MITYNETNFLRKTSLNKEITFPRKVKSKSVFIMSEIKSFNLTNVCSIGALISEHPKNKCLQQNIVFLIRNNLEKENDNL